MTTFKLSNFYNVFLYLLEHKCNAPGCGSVLVIDGNCKNSRDVCKARDAGFVEYEGLQGVVKTGCMNTPKLGSRFCELHAENVAVPQQHDPEATSTQSISKETKESVVAMIMGKRTTRNGTYYQVSSNMFLSHSIQATWNLLIVYLIIGGMVGKVLF